MRIVFCGSPPEAAESLRALAEAGHDIAAVVTRPDRPRGRGRKIEPPAVRREAEALGLDCRQPENVNDAAFVAELAALRPELLIVVAFGAILREPLLALAARGAVNLHFSLLPELRGAAPVEWALLRGYAETGVTTLFMTLEVDAGDILLSRPVPIGPEETAGELRARLARVGAGTLVETVRLCETEGALARRPQDPSRKTLAPRIKPEHAVIAWERPAWEVHNRVRALNPRPGAVTALGGAPLKIWRTALVREGGPEGAPGEIVELGPRGPVVCCGEGTVALREVQEAGRRVLAGEIFARGRRLAPGERLGPGPGPGAV